MESASDISADIRRVCRTHSEGFARAQQTAIGLSEIGDPCDRAVAYRLHHTAAVNTGRDNHLADVGTAWHAWVADAFAAGNHHLGRQRYLIEQRVQLNLTLGGTCDLFDTDTGRVIDHKLLGVTSMRKIRSGELPAKYKVQIHAYGHGHALAGRQVREVALACYPRSDNLGGDFGGAGLHIHVEPYDEGIARHALGRLDQLALLADQIQVEQHPERWSLIQATPSDDCRHCPFFRPQSGPADATGCPGQPVAAPTTLAGIL